MPTERYEEIRAAAPALPDADRADPAHDLVDSIEIRYDDRHEAAWGARRWLERFDQLGTDDRA
ncbi:hypothetical protein RB608_15390 [Nocardioides sp. LHD-245]|uniref:hypothetical protein n=1 Tax=Nocardioides sp. LHD-245 TaxID=3051387 RepID=UPI0027DFFC16|nr:hypothetical protein [Nocardioides sp. LHD-245]